LRGRPLPRAFSHGPALWAGVLAGSTGGACGVEGRDGGRRWLQPRLSRQAGTELAVDLRRSDGVAHPLHRLQVDPDRFLVECIFGEKASNQVPGLGLLAPAQGAQSSQRGGPPSSVERLALDLEPLTEL